MPIENCDIHPSVKIWHPGLVNIYNSSIAKGCTISTFVEIGGAKIGKNSKIGCQVYICPGTVIEDSVFISHGTRFCNILKPMANVSQRDNLNGAIVKQGATIGAGAIILPGITIGKGAFVGAGSIVTRSVDPFVTVVGNPAEPIKYYACECKHFHFKGEKGLPQNWCGVRMDHSLACKCEDYETGLTSIPTICNRGEYETW